MTNNLKSLLSSTIKYGLIVLASVSFCQWANVHLWNTSETPRHTEPPKTTSSPSMTTSITTNEKTSLSDPDLIVSQRFVADVNGETIEVPVITNTSGSTVVVRQTVDVTPLANAMIPNWEIGVGAGVEDRDVYIPLSVQRNYSFDRAVQVELHFDSEGMSGVEVQHKWRF